jgi:hypothetical protein
MGKLISGIMILLAAVPLWAYQEAGDVSEQTAASDRVSGFYIAVGVGYHSKSDQFYKEVYDSGAVNYTADVGCWLNRNLALGIKLSYLHKMGKTVLLKSETTLSQIPLMGYVKAGFGIGRAWQGYVSVGLGNLFFKEESYIGTIKGSRFGWEIETGLEYSFKRNLYFLSALGYQSSRKTFSGLTETQQLGGIGIRVGVGVRFFKKVR